MVEIFLIWICYPTYLTRISQSIVVTKCFSGPDSWASYSFYRYSFHHRSFRSWPLSVANNLMENKKVLPSPPTYGSLIGSIDGPLRCSTMFLSVKATFVVWPRSLSPLPTVVCFFQVFCGGNLLWFWFYAFYCCFLHWSLLTSLAICSCIHFQSRFKINIQIGWLNKPKARN